MINACVIGKGTVGLATMRTFNIEKYYTRSSSNITLEEASKYDFIFICLPTPVEDNGGYYVSDIYAIIEKLSKFPDFKKSVVIIRSTVYPGFNRFLQSSLGITNVVSNPEFLSEDTWKEDADRPQLVVIGGDTPELREKVKGLYQGRFKYNEPIVTDSITAELLKLSMNAFFSTKVIFANEIYSYAQEVGANYEVIRNVLEKHPWGSKGHFQVFHKGGRGVTGKCLPKDLWALEKLSHSLLFQSVRIINQELLKEGGKIW